MPKRPPPEPTPLAAIVVELLARAEHGPPPPWKPDPNAPVQRHRSRYAPHPSQLKIPFDQFAPSASADSAMRSNSSTRADQ